MRAFVTGGTGFIGSHLVVELVKRGWEVVCMVRRPLKSVLPGITCVSGDLARPESIKEIQAAIGKADTLFHLAAVMPSPAEKNIDSISSITANSVGTMHLVDLAFRLKAHSIIYASGITVIGKPKHLPVREDHPLEPLIPYTLGKLYGELYCELMRRTMHQKIISLRITSPYGPGMPTHTVLPSFVQKAIASQPIEWMGEGQRTQNFVHVEDLVTALLLAANSSNAGVYNTAGPSSISMKNLAEAIVKLTPQSKSQTRASGKPDPQDDFRWEIDLSHSRSKLGYYPKISLEQGLKEYIQHVQSGAAGASWWSPL